MQYKLVTINSLDNIPSTKPKPKTTLALIDCISKPVITKEELNAYRKKTQDRALRVKY